MTKRSTILVAVAAVVAVIMISPPAHAQSDHDQTIGAWGFQVTQTETAAAQAVTQIGVLVESGTASIVEVQIQAEQFRQFGASSDARRP